MNRGTDILNDVVVPIVSFFVALVWKPINFIFKFLFKLLTDVAKNVYGKIVVALGALVFGYMVLLFSGFVK